MNLSLPGAAFSLLVAALLLAAGANATDWPRWRGPAGNGISPETAWLQTWSKDGPPKLWKAQVGTGLSSAAVAGGRLLTIGNIENADVIYCFDAETGKLAWKHSYPSDLGDKYFDGGPTSTPTLDGARVYTLGRWGDLFCLEAATGKVLWTTNVQQQTGARLPGWGFAGSPLIHEQLLLLNVGEAGLALDKTTGAVVWKSGTGEAGYSTPLAVRGNQQWIALIASGKSYLAVELASGRELWRIPWLTQYGVNAADPVVEGERMFISTGYGKGGALFKLPAGAGSPEQVWKSKVMRNQLNPSLLIDGHLYGVDGDTTERAALKCVEFSTGVEKWSHPGIGSGAATAAAGKLIVLSEQGELIVAEASPAEFKPSGRAQVLGGTCWTVPVLANGRIYCRNIRGDLVCLDVRKN